MASACARSCLPSGRGCGSRGVSRWGKGTVDAAPPDQALRAADSAWYFAWQASQRECALKRGVKEALQARHSFAGRGGGDERWGPRVLLLPSEPLGVGLSAGRRGSVDRGGRGSFVTAQASPPTSLAWAVRGRGRAITISSYFLEAVLAASMIRERTSRAVVLSSSLAFLWKRSSTWREVVGS